jgi:uncharacterized protein YegP (UPF0339 family)
MSEKFEYSQLEDNKWYFQLKSPNDRIIIQSDGYETEYDCLIAIDVIKRYAEDAEIRYQDELEQY